MPSETYVSEPETYVSEPFAKGRLFPRLNQFFLAVRLERRARLGVGNRSECSGPAGSTTSSIPSSGAKARRRRLQRCGSLQQARVSIDGEAERLEVIGSVDPARPTRSEPVPVESPWRAAARCRRKRWPAWAWSCGVGSDALRVTGRLHFRKWFFFRSPFLEWSARSAKSARLFWGLIAFAVSSFCGIGADHLLFWNGLPAPLGSFPFRAFSGFPFQASGFGAFTMDFWCPPLTEYVF